MSPRPSGGGRSFVSSRLSQPPFRLRPSQFPTTSCLRLQTPHQRARVRAPDAISALSWHRPEPQRVQGSHSACMDVHAASGKTPLATFPLPSSLSLCCVRKAHTPSHVASCGLNVPMRGRQASGHPSPPRLPHPAPSTPGSSPTPSCRFHLHPEPSWLSLVVVHNNSWLLSIAFYLKARGLPPRPPELSRLHPVLPNHGLVVFSLATDDFVCGPVVFSSATDDFVCGPTSLLPQPRTAPNLMTILLPIWSSSADGSEAMVGPAGGLGRKGAPLHCSQAAGGSLGPCFGYAPEEQSQEPV